MRAVSIGGNMGEENEWQKQKSRLTNFSVKRLNSWWPGAESNHRHKDFQALNFVIKINSLNLEYSTNRFFYID